MVEGFKHFSDFGLHEQLHVHAQLAQGAPQEAQKSADFGDVVAVGVPCNQRLLQAQLRAQTGLRFHGAGLQRRQRARCASKFAHQHAAAQLCQALLVAQHGREQPGHLVAKGHGNGLLQIAAAHHGRVAVLSGQLGQRAHDGRHFGLHQAQGFADL